MTRNKMRRRHSQQTRACGMRRSAVLGLFGRLAGGTVPAATTQQSCTPQTRPAGLRPGVHRHALQYRGPTDGSDAPRIRGARRVYLLARSAGRTATAEALLNKTHECDFRWGKGVNALERQGMLAEVELTHACITVELALAATRATASPPTAPPTARRRTRTTSRQIHHCDCGRRSHRRWAGSAGASASTTTQSDAQGALRPAPRRQGFDMPPVAFYEEK